MASLSAIESTFNLGISTSEAVGQISYANVPTMNPQPMWPVKFALNILFEGTEEKDEVTRAPTPVRRVRFSDEVTIIPQPVRHVRFAPSPELVTVIPPYKYLDTESESEDEQHPARHVRFAEEVTIVTPPARPIRRVRFAASPNLVTFIPTPDLSESDSDSEDDNDVIPINNKLQEQEQKQETPIPARTILRVRFAHDPTELRSTQNKVTTNMATGQRLPILGDAYLNTSVLRMHTPPLLLLPTSSPSPPPLPRPTTTYNYSPDTTFDSILGYDKHYKGRDGGDLERTESLGDFVFQATHSRKRKRRARRAYAAIKAKFARLTRSREEAQWAVDWY